MLTLYKFRPLGDCESCNRAEAILETGRFWCAPLWEQNDALEGVYSYLSCPDAGQDSNDVFTAKNRKRICSFSGESALTKPTMWGYYANGFRGIAIQIETEESMVQKVRYRNDIEAWKDPGNGGTTDSKLLRILTTKLTPWRTEREYRYFTDDVSPLQEIGKIRGVYFGEPYNEVQNMEQVVNHSPKFQLYRQCKDRLIAVARRKGYACFTCGISKSEEGKWTVISTPLNH